ncbi:ABC transporter permease [Labrys monachus]|uniref:Ribose/xylose/arabinose/galactoside ABC-type transport system permease subunit n=1 Tax=Labrys monachus TaxID=217067 RepID=A0ABU0FKC3_9HYPH|nr:ABC transporter permease [Labrys monachus]MDQ0394802.1 ribose/xylose/arabinose/galactoside ABC-type transport system permease subunit [Labrys monachus]
MTDVVEGRQSGAMPCRKVLNARVLILVLLAALLGAAEIASHGAFMQVRNLVNILAQNSITGTLAVGQTLVILSGGIDLSLGSITALSSIVALSLQDYGPEVARLGALGVGLGCGLANGLLIVVGRVPPFIATLGMMQAALGLAYVISNGYPVYENDHATLLFGVDQVAHLPLIIILWLLVAAIAWVLLAFTRFGAYVYAIGGNERAAVASGVHVGGVKILIYAIAGLCAAVAGIISINRLGYSQPTIGASLTLDSITPVVLGGTSLLGGVGGVWSTVGGVLVAGVLNNLMVLLGVNIYFEQVVQGAIILLFVFFFLRYQRG